MVIVVGYTPRPEGDAALERAVQEAALRGAALHIVRMMGVSGESTSENPDRVRDWSRDVEQARAEGVGLVEQLRARGVQASFALQPTTTDVAGDLLETVRELGAELLVIGLRRRSLVGKLVLGSVAQDVLLGAEVPVLAIKAEAD